MPSWPFVMRRSWVRLPQAAPPKPQVSDYLNIAATRRNPFRGAETARSVCTVRIEEAVLVLRQPLQGPGAAVVEQGAVSLVNDKEEVSVEAGADADFGRAAQVAFGQQNGIRIRGSEPVADLAPQLNGLDPPRGRP